MDQEAAHFAAMQHFSKGPEVAAARDLTSRDGMSLRKVVKKRKTPQLFEEYEFEEYENTETEKAALDNILGMLATCMVRWSVIQNAIAMIVLRRFVITNQVEDVPWPTGVCMKDTECHFGWVKDPAGSEEEAGDRGKARMFARLAKDCAEGSSGSRLFRDPRTVLKLLKVLRTDERYEQWPEFPEESTPATGERPSCPGGPGREPGGRRGNDAEAETDGLDDEEGLDLSEAEARSEEDDPDKAETEDPFEATENAEEEKERSRRASLFETLFGGVSVGRRTQVRPEVAKEADKRAETFERPPRPGGSGQEPRWAAGNDAENEAEGMGNKEGEESSEEVTDDPAKADSESSAETPANDIEIRRQARRALHFGII